jgi:hypothetical protein
VSARLYLTGAVSPNVRGVGLGWLLVPTLDFQDSQ